MPEGSFPVLPDVDEICVLPMSFADSFCEAFFLVGDSDQVDMIIHKAIGKERYGGLFSVPLHQLKI